MLAWLVRAALTQRVLVLALATLLVVLGLRATGDVPLDVFPEFAPPMVEIQTEAPGLSTEEVESLITVPIETAVNGVPDLMTLRSKSVLGLSSVSILFDRGTDVIRARQLVQERVTQVQARLPAAARPPVMLPPLSSTSRAMKIGISSAKLDQMQLSELARWTIRPRLMAVPGVANVAIWGLRDRQLQVLVDPDRLRAAGVTLAELRAAAGDAVLVGGGGFVDTATQRLAVQQTSAIQSSADLSQAVIKQSGEAPVRIGDVARVVDGFAAPIGNAIIDDGPGLMLIVEKQPTGNTLQLTRDVEAAIGELKPGLRDVKVDTTIFRPATFIERSIDNLTRALAIGCLLVAVVLFVFTRDWRQATISLVAIPLSLLGAGLGAVVERCDDQHDGDRRAGHRARRSRRRRDHRRGEHRAPAAAQPRGRQPALQLRCGAVGLAGSAIGGGVRVADRDAGVPANLLPGRGGGHVLPATRHRLCAGDRRVVAGRSGGDAGDVPVPAAEARPSRQSVTRGSSGR